MLVFWKERLTILAVPKTGSTALQAALGDRADLVVRDPPTLKHAPLYRYNRFFRPMFEKQGAVDMETVAVMREPVDWLASWYRYRSRPFMAGKPNSTLEMQFEEFVAAYASDTPPGFADVGSQAKFLEPRPNGTNVTHLFRYDDLDALLVFLEARLSCKISSPRVNVSPSRETKLSNEVKVRLMARHAEDFALYASIPDGGRHT